MPTRNRRVRATPLRPGPTTPGARAAAARRPRAAPAEAAGPERSAEVERHLGELRRQAVVLFGGFLPLGPQAVVSLVNARLALGAAAEGAGAAGVLDLLLRLSEGIGIGSGFARSLRGAALVVAERGLEDTRIEQVLEAAGVSPRTFYQFFRGKHDALEAVGHLFLSVLTDLVQREVTRPGAPQARLERVARVVVGGAAVVGRLARVVIGEAVRPGGPLEPLYESFRTELAAVLLPVYREIDREADAFEVRVRLMASMGAVLELGLGAGSTAAELDRGERLLASILVPRP